jgi:hypothetical protein
VTKKIKKAYYFDDRPYLTTWNGIEWHHPNRHEKKYRLRYSCFWYGRHVRTFNELRQLINDDAEGLPVRRKRLLLPDWYDDPQVGRHGGRSWKDYTKRRKQWDR